MLTNRTYKRLIALDNADQIVRHITAASRRRIVHELRAELFNGERLGTSDCEEEQDIISRVLAECAEGTTEADRCGTQKIYRPCVRVSCSVCPSL